MTGRLSPDSISSGSSFLRVDTPPVEEKMHRQWACDICKDAFFDNYDDARTHEALCRYRRDQLHLAPEQRQSRQESRRSSREKRDVGQVLRTDNNYANHTRSVDYRSEDRIQASRDPDDSRVSEDKSIERARLTKTQRWLCDVCKQAHFESYVDAYRHEQTCRGAPQQEERHRGKIAKSRSQRRIHKDEKPPRPSHASKSNVKWLCGECEARYFDDYEEACRHEIRCIARRKKQDPLSRVQQNFHV